MTCAAHEGCIVLICLKLTLCTEADKPAVCKANQDETMIKLANWGGAFRDCLIITVCVCVCVMHLLQTATLEERRPQVLPEV